ncbi:hypothetical protein Slu03_20910 [Sediminihabitans luteus]|nr:hypothetical protein Slu03_20910 [Sediminihabitans luteus]
MVFELVDTASEPPRDATGPDGPVGEDVADAAGPGEAPADARRSSRRRTVPRWALVAGALGIVGVLFTGARLHSQHLEAQRVAAPGGLLPMSTAPASLWSAPADVGSTLLAWDDLALVVGDGVRALDPATGEVRWQADLGTATQCGDPERAGEERWSDQLVCLAGEADAREVVVLDRDGEVVAQRSVDADPTDLAATVFGDLLVSATRLGEPVPVEKLDEVQVAALTGEIDGLASRLRPRDVRVVFEDARSGEVVEETVLEAGGDLTACVVVNDGLDSIEVEPDRLDVSQGPATIRVSGCGVGGTFGLDGRPFEGGEVQEVRPLGDGKVVLTGSQGRSTVVDAAGETLWDPDGTILEPMASDGTADATTLVSKPGSVINGALRAFDSDREPLWSSGDGVWQVLVQTAGTAVVVRSPDVVGIDLTTGDELWTTESPEDGFIDAAYTDGTHAIVRILRYRESESDDPSTPWGSDVTATLVAWDLADGSRAWSVRLTDGYGDAPLAIDGSLVVKQEGTVSRLG